MLPDNKDALKVWLVETLNPICDADPETLANYVLALIKKDKSEDDLIELCNRDLEVFLQDHTKEFVDKLFNCLRSKDYLFGGDKSANNQPQANQKLGSSPSARDKGQNSHLTSYKSLPKRDQEQIRPKEMEHGRTRRPERRVDSESVGLRGDKGRPERKHSKSPNPRSRDDLSRERPRRKFSQARNRAVEMSPRDVTSPPLRLGKRSYTRSLSKSVDPHEPTDQEAGRNLSKESSGSLSPESGAKAKRNRSRSVSGEKRGGGGGGKRPRCRMYYEHGFCELGDKCQYDHGKNPVLVSNRDLGLQNAFKYTPPTYLQQPTQPPMGASPLLHHQAPMLPNISQPPPALPFPPHRLPPPHFLPQPGNAVLLTQPPMRPLMPYGIPPTHRPPPPLYPYLHIPTGDLQPDVYHQAVEPYLPEPYSSKPSHFNMPPPPIQGQAPIVKGAWKKGEGDLEGSMAPARQVSNLVHVSIEEGKEAKQANPGQVGEGADQQCYEVAPPRDGNADIPAYTPTPSSVLMARKRSAGAAGLDALFTVPGPLPVALPPVSSEDAKLMPPPSLYIKKTILDHPGVSNRNQSASNTTLELRKIPREDNTISNINDHFSKFGIIVNLQVSWDNDPCAALVSYASSAQASAAYRSKEPFLNNRFIKIFWHNPDRSQQSSGCAPNQTPAEIKPTDKEFKPKPKPYTIPQRHQLQLNRLKKPDENKKVEGDTGAPVDQPDGDPSKTSEVSQDQTKSSGPSVQETDAPERVVIPPRSALKLQRKPAKEIQKAEALKKGQELRAKQQELLKKLLETQKNLIVLHEKAKSSEEKAKYSQLLKNNDTKILELKEEMKKTLAVHSSSAETPKRTFFNQRSKFCKTNKLVRAPSNPGPDATASTGACPTATSPAGAGGKVAVQKAILDGELDLMNSSKNEEEADALKKKICDLKKELSTIKDGDFSATETSTSSSSSYPEFNKYHYVHPSVKEGRTFAKVSRSVDRRTRQILVTGFLATEDKSMLLNHMKNYGQVEKSLYDEKIPFFLVTYKYRSDAEKAMKEGVMFGQTKLRLTWHNVEPSQQPKPAVHAKQQQQQQSMQSSVDHFHPCDAIEDKGDQRLATNVLMSSVAMGTAGTRLDHAVGGGSSLITGEDDSCMDEELNEYRNWGLEGEVDDDVLLGYEDEDEDEDDDEGVRPWRRR